MLGDGCAGPPYPSIRIDHASASARSASRMACLARSRAPSARLLAPAIREPNRTLRDLVLMAEDYNHTREAAQPLGLRSAVERELSNGRVPFSDQVIPHAFSRMREDETAHATTLASTGLSSRPRYRRSAGMNLDRVEKYAPEIQNYTPEMLSIARIVVALLFLEHGSSKLLGFPSPAHGAPEVMTLEWIQGLIELAGGALLAIGLFARPVAFILSGDMAVAYFMAHAPKGFFPVLNGGDEAILYCFIFLLFFVAGPGRCSLAAELTHDQFRGEYRGDQRAHYG